MLLSSVGMAIRLGSVLPCASILAACTPGAPAKPIAAQHLVERDASTLEASVGASPDAAEVDVDDGGAVVAKPNAFRAWLSVQRVAPPHRDSSQVEGRRASDAHRVAPPAREVDWVRGIAASLRIHGVRIAIRDHGGRCRARLVRGHRLVGHVHDGVGR